MRKRLGNITSCPDRKIDFDPAREKLRCATITDHRIRQAKVKTREHLDEMRGRIDPSEAFLGLFDDRGNPPPNFTYDDLVAKFKRLRAQQAWLAAIRVEMENKMRALDPVQYAQDEAQREAAQEKLEKNKEAIRAEFIGDSEGKNRPWLRQVLSEALHAAYKPKEYRMTARDPLAGARICALRQIETALRNLFAEFIMNPALKVPMEPSGRYAVLRRESDWAAIMILDMDIKLMGLAALIDSGKTFLEQGAFLPR